MVRGVVDYIHLAQGPVGGFVNTVMYFGFHKMRTIAWVGEWLLASQEVLYFIEPVGWKRALFHLLPYAPS
jgi:hypothetical protein